MNHARNKRKFEEVLNHRENQYNKALDGLLSGKLPPDYAATRWRKLKNLKK